MNRQLATNGDGIKAANWLYMDCVVFVLEQKKEGSNDNLYTHVVNQ